MIGQLRTRKEGGQGKVDVRIEKKKRIFIFYYYYFNWKYAMPNINLIFEYSIIDKIRFD